MRQTASKNISEFLIVLTRNTEIESISSECLDTLNTLLSDVAILHARPVSMNAFKKLVLQYNLRGPWIHDGKIAGTSMAYGISVSEISNIDNFRRIVELGTIEI